MDGDSISFHEDEELSGDIVMSDDDIDPNYEPTDEEIIKYAIYLGIDPEHDKEFLYLAKEGLMAPVPKPWKACQTRTGELYYTNFETGKSQVDHPCDAIFREKFRELKKLANKEKANKKEQKSMSSDSQKKHQSSKSVQLTLNHKPEELPVPTKFYSTHREFDKESLFSELSHRQMNNDFLNSGQLSLHFDKSPQTNEKLDEHHEGQIRTSESPTLEHSPDFNGDEGNIELQVSERDHDPLNEAMNEANIGQTESDLPHTGNIYDDILSLNNQSVIEGERDGETGEGKKDSGDRGMRNNVVKDDRDSFEKHKEKEMGKFKEKFNKRINFYDDDYDANKVLGEEFEHNQEENSEHNLDKSINPDGLFNLSHSQNWGESGNIDSSREPKSRNDVEEHIRSARTSDNARLLRKLDKGSLSERSEETLKKKKKVNNKSQYEAIENEFNELYKRYEEDIKGKFNEILQESEQNHQEEIHQIQREFKKQLENIKVEHERSPIKEVEASLEEEKEKMRKMLVEKNEKELQEEFQQLQRVFEKEKKELEGQEESKFKVFFEGKSLEEEIESEKEKKKLTDVIEENIRAVQDLHNQISKTKTERDLFKSKRLAIQSDLDDQLRQLELQENVKLQKEIDEYKEDFDDKLENEKIKLEEAYQNSQEELKSLRVRLEESYSKSLLEERDRLNRQHEADLHELETRMERIASQNAFGKAKVEHDKRMNVIQVDKMLHEKQNKKRVEEMQSQFLKKFELEKMSYESYKTNEMKLYTSDINNLLNQLLVKENYLTNVRKHGKEIESTDKESVTKSGTIRQFNVDISELETQSKKLKAQIEEYQSVLQNLKSKLSMKNSTLKKVNELHQQIDKIEQEISSVNEKIHQSQQKVNPMDYATNDTVISQPAAMNKISKLFKEVEEIKNVVQKRAVRKSISVSRISAAKRHHQSYYDPTNESKLYSIMNNTDHEISHIDASKPILENLDKEPLLQANRVLKKGPEPKKRSSLANSAAHFLLDKRQKETIQPASQKSLSLHAESILYRPSHAQEKKRAAERRDEWADIIETEKRNVEKYEYALTKKKAEVKEVHRRLKVEAEQYKYEYNAFKNSKNPTQISKEQLEDFKGALNEKINEYNLRLSEIREKESILKLKQQALDKLESLYEESLAGKTISHTKLNDLYVEYNKIGSKHKADEKSKSFDMSSNPQSRKSLAPKKSIDTDNQRMSINLGEIFQRNKGTLDKNRSIGNIESVKENHQPRSTGLEIKDKLFDKVKSSLYQRSSVSRPFPSSTQNIKKDYESNKLLREYSSLGKK